ncbi:MAG: Cof-type HAD-IIB family hydrolase, partial [Planctomycetes bacterium]|nr:Cof-type HAD-IIB family hydrolase [Planctomycetota bacterium]
SGERKVRVIALDIDGTLFSRDGTITGKTRDALLRAQEKGCSLVLASGRPTAGLRPIAKELRMDEFGGFLVGYNGGAAAEYPSGTVIFSDPIPMGTAKAFLRHLEPIPVTPILDDGTDFLADDPDGFKVATEMKSNRMGLRLVENICDALDFAPAKILVAAPEEILSRHEEAICASYVEELSFIRSTPYYLETTCRGVDKGRAVQGILQRLGLSTTDLVAFGDADNDFSLCKLAGIGIAMGNACDDLKAVTDMVTTTNNDDGIACALEKLGI